MLNEMCTTHTKKASKKFVTKSDLIDTIIEQHREISKLKLKVLQLSCHKAHNNNQTKRKYTWQQ